MGQPNYADGFAVRAHPHMLDLPRRWARPKHVFVNSMGDLFHEDVDLSFVEQVFKTMNETPRHVFQVLTKRADRLAQLAPELNWTANIWMGVTVEDNERLARIERLMEVPASVRFVSIEPLLTALPDLEVDGLDWVIVGGESGPGARPVNPDWVRDIRNRCVADDVPFFFKQWGGARRKKAGRELDGARWDEMPRHIA